MNDDIIKRITELERRKNEAQRNYDKAQAGYDLLIKGMRETFEVGDVDQAKKLVEVMESTLQHKRRILEKKVSRLESLVDND